MGVDVAGVIETIGESVVSWNRGDQVFYHTTWRKDGSYAEFNVAPAHTFARIPEGISFVDAATLPYAALTAYCALYRRLHVREGDIVLVHAAAGGVGGFAVQLAKAAKAFVIGTCSAPNAKYVTELGADEVINYRSEDVFERAKAIAGDRGIDAIRSDQLLRNKLRWKQFRRHWNDWPRGTSEAKLLPECKADSGQRGHKVLARGM